jgi:hypothetical protein
LTATSLACFGGHWDLINGARLPDWSAELRKLIIALPNGIADCQLQIANFLRPFGLEKPVITIGNWQLAVGNRLLDTVSTRAL